MALDPKRNRWLRKATTALRPILKAAGRACPPQPVTVQIGHIETNGAYFFEATPIFPAHIVMNRAIDDSFTILGLLLHELCHYATETECATHGNAFRTVAKSVGLSNGKNAPYFWITPSPSLHRNFEQILNKLGTYPPNLEN